MIYRIITRVLQKHAFFHLAIPLAVGVLVEAAYAHYFHHVSWARMSGYLISPPRLVLYAGIFAAYFLVVGLLLKAETTVGMRRMKLEKLAEKLHGAKRLFAVAPTPVKEWFDPAAQVYFTTLLASWLSSNPRFRYERVLLLPTTSARADLESPFFEGYYAKCLWTIHQHFGIKLYYLDWNETEAVLNKLDTPEKVSIGYYPKFATWRLLPQWLVRALLWPTRRRRIRRIAGGVIEDEEGVSTFRFAKHENVVEVDPQDPAHTAAYLKFVAELEAVLYAPDGKVKTEYDVAKVY